MKKEEYSPWQIDGHQIELKMFLSDNELKKNIDQQTLVVERDYDNCKQDALAMAVLFEGKDDGSSNTIPLIHHNMSTRPKIKDFGGLVV